MTEPLTLSVVMPVYNVADYVGPALKSILDQDFGDFLIYVVEGGSTDGSREIVDAMDDPRIRVIEHPFRGHATAWVAEARNQLIHHAESRYVAMADADDLSLPGRFRRQLAVLDDNPDLAAVTVGGGMFTDEGRAERAPYSGELQRSRMDDEVVFLPDGHLQSMMVRTDTFRDLGGYDPRFPQGEDYDLWLRIAEGQSVGFLDVPDHLYRLHSRSITSTVPGRGDVLRTLTHELARLRKDGDDEAQARLWADLGRRARAPWYYSIYIAGIRNAKIALIDGKPSAAPWLLTCLVVYPRRMPTVVRMLSEFVSGRRRSCPLHEYLVERML